MNFIQQLKNHHINIFGWRTKRKIIVFESDDWGSIRMPDKKTYHYCLQKGIPLEKSPYCKFDTLANEEDFDALFSLLKSFKDINGRNPAITANTVISNPDFKKIKESKFEEYHFETFTDTLDQYYPNRNVFDIWNEGIKNNLFLPQFHGREHVNVYHWLKALKKNSILKTVFNHGFWGIPRSLYKNTVPVNLQATYDAKKEFELEYHKKSISEGLLLFEKIFHFKSKSFIPNNFVFDKLRLSKVLNHHEISTLQGMKYHISPCYNRNKHPLCRRHLGKQNGFVQLVRNCVFEPSQENSKTDVVNDCLSAISTSFFWKKPAIITTHRLNFVGAIDENNRYENLKLFKELLSEIVKRWPDVEFLTSDKLGDLIETE